MAQSKSNVLTVNYQSKDAPQTFVRSLKSTGFAVISNHGIKHSLITKVYNEWKKFFASTAKHDYLRDKGKQAGYFPFLSENAKGYSKKDLKEFYHFYLWGRLPKGMSNATKKLFKQLVACAATLLQWTEEQTPETVRSQFSMPLPEMIKGSNRNLLRIIHYPPLTGKEEEGTVRAAAHEDINLLTVLVAGTQIGLQAQDLEGNWHMVSCDPGMLVVNAGDMLKMCSGGYYPSTKHRVINPTGEDAKKSRYSMPLFLHPRDEVRLSKTHTAKSYLLERLEEIGLKK
ncbi:isopenicillin N synthase family oxygenase [Patescibacteria group bacterium AH-259-L05]|nr:isopenicillin N synthase family oxygenase [Patescibacteria group bacterium AH-259-L05]